MRTTLKYVARHLGISTSTISRVVRGDPGVHASTRERVKAAIAELGYTPHPMASALKSGHGGIIQVVLESEGAELVPAIFAGIADAAQKSGYRSLTSTMRYERESLPIDERLVEGIVVVSDFEHEVDLRWLRRFTDVPIVCAYGYAREDANAVSVVSDDFGGAMIATEHLLSLGRRRIAIIGGIPHWIQSQQRISGYLRCLERHGIRPDENIIEQGDWTRESGYAACLRLLNKARFDGIFTANDKMAAGVLHCLSDAEITVPEHVSVVGFDDRDLCKYVTPPLTSVALPLQEMGRRSVQLLVERIRSHRNGDRLTSEVVTVPCALARRNSSRHLPDLRNDHLRKGETSCM